MTNNVPSARPQEYAVQIRDGEKTLGVTYPVENLGEARSLLVGLQCSYPDSTLAYRTGTNSPWQAVTEDGITQLIYQNTADVLASLIGEGLTPIHWELMPFRPGEIEGRDIHGRREVVAEYAALLGVQPVESPGHSENVTQVSVTGTHRGVKVTVYATVYAQVRASATGPVEDGGEA